MEDGDQAEEFVGEGSRLRADVVERAGFASFRLGHAVAEQGAKDLEAGVSLVGRGCSLRRVGRPWVLTPAWAYVDHGFQEVPEGLALRCDREVEAELFATGAEYGAFARLHELATPVRLVVTDRAGELEASLALLPEALANVTTTYMAGQNHLVPVERPDLVAGEVADALKTFS